jgi:methyl-accepting chemotaxis protein
MRFLDDLKISVKILSVIGLLSAVTALVVILGAVSLHSVDQTYSQLAVKEEPAILALARGARSVNILGYAAYRSIAYPPTPSTFSPKPSSSIPRTRISLTIC